MEHRDVFLIEIIIDYCGKIAKYLREKNVSRDAFLSDSYHQDICAFYCLQIGETAASLSEKFTSSYNEIEWRKIIGLRNTIAHEYGSIDPVILWDSIEHNIPELEDYCRRIIE